MPTCYIIMPITTPELQSGGYQNDWHHFEHVLDHLFRPAIEAAGMTPIPPLVVGAEIIQSEIVTNLETSDVVLCDMSTLNANVFFELGIRTSLNKPVCLVRDEITSKVPFDMSIINHCVYSSRLHPWELTNEVAKLAKHLKESLAKSGGLNPLWKHFGLFKAAVPYAGTGGLDEKIDALAAQVASLGKAEGTRDRGPSSGVRASEQRETPFSTIAELVRQEDPAGNELKGLMSSRHRVIAVLTKLPLSDGQKSQILRYLSLDMWDTSGTEFQVVGDAELVK